MSTFGLLSSNCLDCLERENNETETHYILSNMETRGGEGERREFDICSHDSRWSRFANTPRTATKFGRLHHGTEKHRNQNSPSRSSDNQPVHSTGCTLSDLNNKADLEIPPSWIELSGSSALSDSLFVEFDLETTG